MDYLELRGCVVEFLAGKQGTTSLVSLLQELAKGRLAHLCQDKYGQPSEMCLPPELVLKLNEVLHEMSRCGIVAPAFKENYLHPQRGNHEAAHGVPFQVTDYGRHVLAGDSDVVWDPTGILDGVRRRVPELDDLELSYLRESVEAFHSCLYNASLVMLGAASEILMVRIIRDTARFLQGGGDVVAKLEKTISTGFGAWRKRLADSKTHLSLDPDCLRAIDHTFEIIRRCRNEAAHPRRLDVHRLACIMHERRGGKRGNASGARRMRV
jgi:hypothetical protein